MKIAYTSTQMIIKHAEQGLVKCIDTFITRLLANVPMRRGPAKGSTHVANIKNRKSHPDNANQMKKIVYKRKKVNCLVAGRIVS